MVGHTTLLSLASFRPGGLFLCQRRLKGEQVSREEHNRCLRMSDCNSQALARSIELVAGDGRALDDQAGEPIQRRGALLARFFALENLG